MQERVLDNAYRLLEEIGRGGFGAVYRAVRVGSEGSGQVAIKILNRNPKLSSEDYIRFQREATVMSQLIHPGIVTVFELSEDTGAYFIAMEFVAGQNLREFVKSRNGKLSLSEIVDILIQAAEALEYVHAHAVIHRDIKPQNILIDERNERGQNRNQVKLVDFGVARLGIGTESLGDGVVGTYAYMAPEATGLTDWEMDERTDIYSLGIVAYELIAGKVPFHEYRNDDILRAHVEIEPPSIRSIRDQDIPLTLENIIRKCIEKKPANRYQSMFGLVCDLKRIQVDLRTRGVIENFEIGVKDIGLGKILDKTFVARDLIVNEIVAHFGRHQERSTVEWGIIRSGVGIGKTRTIHEIKQRLLSKSVRVLSLRFSESEQRLPLQALSLSINEILSQMHRSNKSSFRKYLNAVVLELGSVVQELGRFIPILRQFVVTAQGDVRRADETSSEVDSVGYDSAEFFSSASRSLDRRFVAPSQRLNDAVMQMLSMLLDEGERFVLLLDDIHHADASMLSLLTYLLDDGSVHSRFSIILTMREQQYRPNIVLDNFMRRLNEGDAAIRTWTLLPFEKKEIQEFFVAIGLSDPSAQFVKFVHEKTGGSALQINALVKQMLAQDALLPNSNTLRNLNAKVSLEVSWERLQKVELDFVSIEILLGALDAIDKRDLSLLKIAAVSYDACEFEYFLVEQGLMASETEKRLMSLAGKGFLEITGDEHAPIRRRSFIFSHEKIRNAILSKLDIEGRRQIHYLLTQKIIAMYRTPQKEQLLALAKHCDGAGDKVPNSDSVKHFLRAAKVYIAANENNQARYYIDKAMENTHRIQNQKDRLQRLRECYEAEYMIQASIGNLAEASEVCRNLLEITYDKSKREMLRVFLAQLLLGLGRHQQAFLQANEVVNSAVEGSSRQVIRVVSTLNDKLLGTFWYKYVSKIIFRIFCNKSEKVSETFSQSLVVMAFSHLHGGEPGFSRTMSIATKMRMLEGNLDRDQAVLHAVLAVMLLNKGKVSEAYKISEDAEYFLQRTGLKNQYRWLMALRSIWIDYPMGRMDRLYAIIDAEPGTVLPSSGVMHFETLGLRAWLSLICPSSRFAQVVNASEGKRRRKSDKDVEEKIDIEGLSSSNNVSRRIIDSGENSQYTALALFSDSMRFALSDKIEPLRRAVEQLRRQSSVSPVGDAFADFASSFHALVLGHQHEALKFYQRGTLRVVNIKIEVMALLVCDALRFAIMIIPLLAISLRSRDWPWGKTLRAALIAVDKVLRSAEGLQNPRRTPMTSLFQGFVVFLEGKRHDALAAMERAVIESRGHRVEFLEALSLSLLGAFSGRQAEQRAIESFRAAVEIARRYDLRLLERYVQGLASINKIDIIEQKNDGIETSIFRTSVREKQSTVGLSEVLVKMRSLHAKSNVDELLVESIRILSGSLNCAGGVAYLRENGRSRFVRTSFDGNDFGEHYADGWISKILSNSCDDPVRVVPMDECDSNTGAGAKTHSEDVCSVDSDATVSTNKVMHGSSILNDDEKTVAQISLDGEDSEATVAGLNASDTTAVVEIKEGEYSNRDNSSLVEKKFVVLLALVSNKSLLGWIAIPNVPASAYSSREVEQDLVLLGLHVGHLLIRLRPDLLGDDDLSPQSLVEQSAKDVIDGDVPRGTLFEFHGRHPSGSDSGWRVFGLRNDQAIFSQWQVDCKNSSHAKRVGEFIGRHLQFFVYSVRQSSDVQTIDNLLLKISSDLITILENLSADEKLDDVKIAIVIWDKHERRAVEGDFGGESLGFGGSSEVEREYLQEIHSVLSSDRLVYHERMRKLAGSGGWIFGTTGQLRSLYSRFSGPAFVERYLDLRIKKNARLFDSLRLKGNDSNPFFAVFVPEQD